MLQKIGNPEPPKGLKLKLFRLPILLYRYRLGFVFGSRFLLLKHRGRISGNLNETVLEVIHHEASPEKYFVASGFGEKSQWYKNICANNEVFITARGQEYRATATVVDSEKAKAILLKYADKHPGSIKAVAKLSGFKMDGTTLDIIEFSDIVRIIELAL